MNIFTISAMAILFALIGYSIGLVSGYNQAYNKISDLVKYVCNATMDAIAKEVENVKSTKQNNPKGKDE